MSIDLVIFDIAGTTVHDGNAVNGSLRAALGAAGLQVTIAAINAVMGLPKPEAIRLLLQSLGQDATKAAVMAIHRDFAERMRGIYAHDPAVRAMPGAAATFAALRRAGIKVALDTGFDRAIVNVLLGRLGWDERTIDASVTSDEVPRGRPYPDMIFHLMRQLGIEDAGRVAKVGDTRADLEEGTNAGCGLVVGVTSGSSTHAELESCPHTCIVESVAEVRALVLTGVPEVR